MDDVTANLQSVVGSAKNTITMWDPNVVYNKDEIILYLREETEQTQVDYGLRTFAFILVSTINGNASIPNYDLVDGIPDF